MAGAVPVTVLVVAAHPDDEVLGCGATIARHTTRGDEVHILILGTGVAARGGTGAEVERGIKKLRLEADLAGRRLGVASVRVLDLPDNRFDTVPLLAIVRHVEEAVSRVKPDTVYTHHAGDLNIDHRLTHQAVVTACRFIPGSRVSRVFAFEVPSATEQAPAAGFEPDWYNDVTDTLGSKLEALRVYGDEVREFPHPRSVGAVTALAQWRGATVGVAAAEAFRLVRARE